jgi:hypothetical protein
MIKERTMVLANNAVVAICHFISKQLRGSVHTNLGAMNSKDLPPELRDALAKSEPGATVPPFFSAAALEMIFRYDGAADALTK